MKNNRKAYRIYMALSPESRKTLSFEYEIEKVENTENKKWNNRFLFNFWNWLWMKKFKKDKAIWIPLMQRMQKLKNEQLKLMAEGPFYKGSPFEYLNKKNID